LRTEHTKLSYRLRIKPEIRDKKCNRPPAQTPLHWASVQLRAHSTYAIPWYQCLRDNANPTQQNDTKQPRGDEPASDPANTALTKLTPSIPLPAMATDSNLSLISPDDVKVLNKAARRQLAKQLLAETIKYEKAAESLQNELPQLSEDLNASSDVAEKAYDAAREAADAVEKIRGRLEAIREATIAVGANMAAVRALINEIMECDKLDKMNKCNEVDGSDEVDESDEDEYDEHDDIDE
jgi:hypothetical protein